MNTVTILGNLGETFSAVAWPILAKEFDIPRFADKKCIPAFVNRNILSMTAKHGGYGVIAIETICDGNVVESIDSFVPLLSTYDLTEKCPIKVIGAIGMTLNICLLTQEETEKANIKGIIAHGAAIRACKAKIPHLPIIEVANNGEAARLVAEEDQYREYAALGPCTAAETFKLKIEEENFQTEIAVTTFALIGPKHVETPEADVNQGFIIFSVENSPGTLVSVLELFSRENLNMKYIRSVHVIEATYHHIVSFSLSRTEIPRFNQAVKMLPTRTKSHLVFGPFPIIPR